MSDTPAVPMAHCPVDSCDWSVPYPESGNLDDVLVVLQGHNSTHTADEFLATIARLQADVIQAKYRIEELESALRGANTIIEAGNKLIDPTNSGLTVITDRHHGDQITLPDGSSAQLAGKRLPDHIAEMIGIKRPKRKGPRDR